MMAAANDLLLAAVGGGPARPVPPEGAEAIHAGSWTGIVGDVLVLSFLGNAGRALGMLLTGYV